MTDTTNQPRPPHQQRVLEEEGALGTKTAALYAFLATPLFKSLPEAERDRLRRQHAAMTTYLGVLRERISAW